MTLKNGARKWSGIMAPISEARVMGVTVRLTKKQNNSKDKKRPARMVASCSAAERLTVISTESEINIS